MLKAIIYTTIIIISLKVYWCLKKESIISVFYFFHGYNINLYWVLFFLGMALRFLKVYTNIELIVLYLNHISTFVFFLFWSHLSWQKRSNVLMDILCNLSLCFTPTFFGEYIVNQLRNQYCIYIFHFKINLRTFDICKFISRSIIFVNVHFPC